MLPTHQLTTRLDALDLDKENRLPPGMAVAKKERNHVANTTPSRRNRVPLQIQQNYFEPGRVGRKTGITLRDTGIRDEHGLEPVSGIFSSPSESSNDEYEDTEDVDAFVQNSTREPRHHIKHNVLTSRSGSRADNTEVLVSRARTPRLPPARSATPRHTNIGSPKRMSTSRRQPATKRDGSETQNSKSPQDSPHAPLPANRKLDFQQQNVRNSIENTSPFRPRKTLRRSVNVTRPDAYEMAASPDDQDNAPQPSVDNAVEAEAEAGASRDDSDAGEPAGSDFNGPNHDVVDDPMFDDSDGNEDFMDIAHGTGADLEDIEAAADEQNSPSRRSLGPSRKSEPTAHAQSNHSPRPDSRTSTPSKKRNRASMELTPDDAMGEVSAQDIDHEPVQSVEVRRSKSPRLAVDEEEGAATIDPSLLAHDDEDAADAPSIAAEAEMPKTKGKKKGKAKAPTTRKPAATPSAQPTSPSKRSMSRAGSLGPVSNVHLRSTTPFEDAEGRTSRYGRTLTQPLKYWANETRVWKHGEIEGVVRAEEVEKAAQAARSKKQKRRARKPLGSKLEDIEEISDTESLLPDDWEEEIGVMAGTVADWNREAQLGNPDDPIREDLAFSSSAIVTREAVNADFRFAKIMTLPFFGSGIVEMPPGGYKREKPSGKMQMVFFVHEGKVAVEVGSQGMEINRFTISKGGVWVVPRGNKYAITNESRTKTARIFFAQGCEVDISITATTNDGS